MCLYFEDYDSPRKPSREIPSIQCALNQSNGTVDSTPSSCPGFFIVFKMTKISLIAALFAALALTACGKKEEAAPAPAPAVEAPAAAPAEAEENKEEAAAEETEKPAAEVEEKKE
jgi:hypothetical protein